MKNKQQRTMIAEAAISLLRDGILKDSKTKILAAYDIVEDENFSWIDLDVCYMEWEELIDEANQILNEL